MNATNGVRIPFDAVHLMARSRAMTGIDIDDSDVVEPLTVLLNSLNTESHLHAEGALLMEDKLLRLLANRLRMQRDFARHPEIGEQIVAQPVMLCGLPRTGTTKLQHALAATGDFNWLPLWQASNPALLTGSRDESPQPRIDDADRFWRRFNEASPDARIGHIFDTFTADEDTHIQEHSFVSSPPFAYSEVPGYLQWLAVQNPRRQFDYLRRTLQYLQWQGLQQEGKPWLLKCPLNVGMQPLLREIFPDARLVMTHRDPVEVVASACSLLDSFHKPFTHDRGNYAAVAGGFVWQIQQHMADRQTHDLALMDVPYLDAVRNAEQVAERIYSHAGIAFTASTRQRIRDWERTNPQHRHGVHRYSLQDYGFDKQQLDGQFADYRKLMAQIF